MPVVLTHPLDVISYADRRSELPAATLLQIHPLTNDHIPVFAALRLDALRHHPEAFIPTYEEEIAVDPAAIASRFRNDWISDGNFILGAFSDGRLVGAVGVRRWARRKQRHRATVWLLFTDHSVRGQGIGRALLGAAIEQCRHHPEIELLQLSVSAESDTARRLYVNAGFQHYGMEPRAIKLTDRYVDVELMVLDLKATPIA
jgi:ribosomal protein S18 acetylase RimI-like enzyme